MRVKIPHVWLQQAQIYLQKNHHLIGKFKFIMNSNLPFFEYKWKGNYGDFVNHYYSVITTYNSNKVSSVQFFDREENMIKEFFPPES